MKSIKLLFVAVFLVLGATSCQSVHVVTDYDQNADFNQYKTFAFYKPGIDKAKISDLDKRRILRAISSSLEAKGLTKSKESPDILVSIFTKSTKNINVYNNHYGWGGPWGWWGYGPYWNNYYNSIYTDVDGALYINIIDTKKKVLVWQGVGEGGISPEGSVPEKIERINTIVNKILAHYPPGVLQK